MIKPKVGTDVVDVMRGSGELAYKEDYLKTTDPITYYYEKFKRTGNKYLSDEMWTEAAKHGESAVLVDLLARRQADDKLKDTQTNIPTTEQSTESSAEQGTETKAEVKGFSDEDNSWYDKWKEYAGYNDYDSYMLALSIPTLDDTTKKTRTNETGDYTFGDYTDKEWAKVVLQNQFGKYDAQIIEDKKSTQSFWKSLGGYLGSTGVRLTAGVSNFVGDVYNIFEGVVNIFANWSNDADIGNRFLAAFANEDGITQLVNNLHETAFQIERDQAAGMFDAVKAYETGDVNAGYTTWGRWYSSGIESLGYMLPSMLLTQGLSAGTGLSAKTLSTIGTATFYTGVASGNVSDIIQSAELNGLSYKDLNAGEVITNAVGKAAAQWAVEVVLGKVLGWSYTDKAIRGGEAVGGKIAKDIANIGATEGKAFGKHIAGVLKSASKEGLEEVLQDMSDGLIDYVYSKTNSNLSTAYAESAAEKYTMQNLLDSFIVGAAMDITTGMLTNIKYVVPHNRAADIDTDGKMYRLGAFQTMNLTQSMQTLNEWNSILNDPKAKLEVKQDTALKMTVAVDTISSLFKVMGNDRTIKANNLLVKYLNDNTQSTEVAKLSDSKYASDLYNTFMTKYAITKQYVNANIRNQVKKAIEDKAADLKKAGVDNVETVITEKVDPNDPDIPVDNTATNKLKDILAKTKATTIVGVNTTKDGLVTKSGDVIFVDNKLVLAGDITAIITGAGYDSTRAAVKASLSQAQKNMILDQFNKVTGLKGTLDDAVDALLFDKQFYTKILLLSKERNYKNESIELLAMIDQVVKTQLVKANKEHTLTEDATLVLMKKVQETMKAGLINYATQFVDLDLDKISTTILSAEDKATIRNNPNVKFINDVKAGIEHAKQNITVLGDIDRYMFYLSKFNDLIPLETINKLSSEIRSNNQLKKLDAWASLQFIAATDSRHKLLVLSTGDSNFTANEQISINKLETLYGMTLAQLSLGNINDLQLSPEAISTISANKFTVKQFIENKAIRLYCLSEALFEISGATLTLDTKFVPARIIDKNDLIQSKYLNEKGDADFMTELKKKKVMYVGDIVKDSANIPSVLKSVAITYNTNMGEAHGSASLQTGILLDSTSNLNVVMHELTHIVQEMVAYSSSGTDSISLGGNYEMFRAMQYDEQSKLNKYLFNNFPVLYDLFKNNTKNDYTGVVYYLLNGEIEARASLNTIVPALGFMYNKDRNTLKSPDGKVTFDLTVAQIGPNKKIPGFIDRTTKKAGADIITKAKIKTDKTKVVKTDITAADEFIKTKGLFSKNKKETTEVEKQRKDYYKSRYISNKVASESNLKYFIKKGKPITLDPGIKNFVISTTSDFDKLPIVLKDQIKNGTLTYDSILDYVATAANIDNYTFKAIAKHIFNNNELAKITAEDMRKLQDNITEYAALAYMVKSPESHMTPSEIKQYYKATVDAVKSDNTLSTNYLKAQKLASSIKVATDKGTRRVESFADPEQLNILFFNHYDGSLNSLRNINNLAKDAAAKQGTTELVDEATTGDYGETTTKSKSTLGAWNWTDRLKKATTKYEYDTVDEGVLKTVGTIEKVDKINAIEKYLGRALVKNIQKLSKEKQALWTTDRIARAIDKKVDELYDLSDKELDQKYLKAIGHDANKSTNVEDIVAKPTKEQVATTKTYKDRLRNLGRTISTRIAGLKSRYNKLSDTVKQYIDPANKYKLKSDYRNLSDADLQSLIEAFKTDSKKLRATIAASDRAAERKRVIQDKLDKMAKKTMSTKTTDTTDTTEKKTLREKVRVEYKTTIKEQRFSFRSNTDSNSLVKSLLSTSWDKSRMSTVQGLSNNKEKNIANSRQFFEQNASELLAADVNTIEEACRWFLTADMYGVAKNSDEYSKFIAVKDYFLSYAFGQSGSGKLYENMNANLKQQIEDELKADRTLAGTLLGIAANTLGIIDPMSAMQNADMVLDDVVIDGDIKQNLFDAISSNNIAKIQKAQADIINYVESKKTNKKAILRKIVSVRSMMMLSSPVTWLRNKVSNVILKPLNKLASAIGNKLFTKKTVEGQLKLNKAITPAIQKYITDNFIDNKLFDTLVNNLSKYNPSDINEKLKGATGAASKEAIMAQLVLKSMYNEYYNKNTFKSKFMNDIHQSLMKVMSDDSYVREAAIRYFGKMLAEKGYDLSTNKVSDQVMNDFASSLGLALNDYMHSDNFFNSIEKSIASKSDLGWFAYKTLLPFASASWNWFKAAINTSPIGLGRAIVKLARLEKNIQKAEVQWQSKNTDINPELTEYKIRRDLGQGIIGTIAWGAGMLLAGLGFIKLKDDDYGVPKLKIGNLSIDISSIFGSSSLLAGAALVTGIQDKASFLEGLNRMSAVTLDGLPLLEIIQMDMYSTGSFNMITDYLENVALSFIPNVVSWIAGATYSGTLKKNTLWERAIAKIPFLNGLLLQKKVDPYTGTQGSWWDAANRVIPYFSYEAASQNEKTTNELGLNKSQLNGTYKINDESFSVSGKDLTAINKSYGTWNAADLTKFYNNNLSVKVKVGNSYKTLSYNNMTNEQRKSAVQTLMSNNAELAKIMAWTLTGNKYYASADMYNKLRQHGVTSNVYRGTKGFVSK